jgi:hypothetical protein
LESTKFGLLVTGNSFDWISGSLAGATHHLGVIIGWFLWSRKERMQATGTSTSGATTPTYNEKRMSVRDWEREFKDFARGKNFLAIILGTEDDPKDQTNISGLNRPRLILSAKKGCFLFTL